MAFGSTLLRESTQVQLEQQIDRNWRGAYDILVLPPGVQLDVERTDGLVEPNFLGFGGRGGITMAQLDAIRALDGVDLAAPVMTVGFLRHIDPVPSLFVSQLPSRPTAYRLSLSATSNDGLDERLIQSQVGHVVLGPADLASPEPPPFTSDLSFSWATDGVEIAFSPLPSLGGMVIAVDPRTEMELLGSTAGFLESLAAVESVSREAATFDVSRIPADEFALEALEIESARSATDQMSRPVVPMVASRELYADLSLSIKIEEVATLDDYPPGVDSFADLPATSSPLSAEISGAELMRPFAAPSLTLLWPGSNPPDGTTFITDAPSVVDPVLMRRPDYEQREPLSGSGAPSFTIAQVGVVTAAGEPIEFLEAMPQRLNLVVGTEAAYRKSEPSEDLGAVDPLFAPLGSFDLDELDLPDNPLNYVPLGAYDPPATALIADDDGTVTDPVSMSGTLNPVGLIAGPPLAITDLTGAADLTGSVSIDAVRIRVRDVDRFTVDGQRRVEAVAAELRGLGLDARVVAGSSPQRVEIFVPGYLATADTADDLGWVEQRWTTLGAAVRASGALTGSTLALMGLALLSAAAFAMGGHFAQQSVRLREIGIQRALGWQEEEIRWWHISEALSAGLLLVASSTVVWLVVGGVSQGLIAAIGLSATYAAGSAIGSMSLTRITSRRNLVRGGEAAWRPVRRPVVGGAVSYGLRAAFSRPIRGAAIGTLLAVAGIAAAAGTEILLRIPAQAGPTLLATFLTDSLRLGQLTILFVSAVGAAAFVAFLIRHETVERRDEWRALAVAGWSRTAISAARAGEIAPVAGLSSIVAGSVAVLTSALIDGAVTLPGPAAGVLTVLFIAVIATATSLRKAWGTGSHA